MKMSHREGEGSVTGTMYCSCALLRFKSVIALFAVTRSLQGSLEHSYEKWSPDSNWILQSQLLRRGVICAYETKRKKKNETINQNWSSISPLGNVIQWFLWIRYLYIKSLFKWHKMLTNLYSNLSECSYRLTHILLYNQDYHFILN